VMAGGQLDGRRILSAESIASMGSNQIGGLELRTLTNIIPGLAVNDVTLPGALDKFGLGLALNSKAAASGRAANTMSWAGIYNTFFWIDREKQISAVLLTQMLPFLDAGPRTLLEEFDRAVYTWRAPRTQAR
jgi:methyl acetate hydrolase